MIGYLIFACGILFGAGLAISTMAKPEVIFSFLYLEDMGLLIVLLTAAFIAGISFQLFKGKKAPLTNMVRGIRNYPLGKNTMLGGILFGLGWGISGVCPGAAYASLGMGNAKILFAIVGMLIGVLLYFFSAKKYPQSKIIVDHDK